MGPNNRKKYEMINFYELPEVKALAPIYHNPNYDIHGISIPFRMIIIGASGSGKTNIVMNILYAMSNTFNKIYLFTKNSDEPLYNFLKSRLDSSLLEVHEGLDYLNENDLNKIFKGQCLVIFDDLVLEKDQSQIEQLFIRGRKLGKCVSSMYLSQSYTGIPKKIRGQANFIILRKVPSERDIKYILKESSCGVNAQTLMSLYQKCVTDDICNFLMLDLNQNPENMFRKNLDIYINF